RARLGGERDGINVDNAALSARFGDKMSGWDGIVNPFVIFPTGSSQWARTDYWWTGRSVAPNGDVLNDYEGSGPYADQFGPGAAWGLDTNVGTLWLQR